jgi:hypothetical protein
MPAGFAAGLLAGFLAAAAPAFAAAPDIAYDFDRPPEAGSQLADMLILGTEGDWTGEVADGEYRLYNTSAPNTLKYFYTSLGPAGAEADLSGATVTLDATTDARDGNSGAGILYRFDPATQTYFAFTVTGEGYAVFVRDSGGLNRVLTGSLPGGPPAGQMHLAVRQKADGSAEFLVGEAVVGSVSNGDVHGAQLGFVAFGAGEFAFDNFAVYRSGADAPEASAGAAASGGPPPEAHQYYVAENNQPVGPLSLAEVEARIAAGTLAANGLVWVVGTPDWVAAGTLPELADALGQ